MYLQLGSDHLGERSPSVISLSTMLKVRELDMPSAIG